jgi:hypothetical protein
MDPDRLGQSFHAWIVALRHYAPDMLLGLFLIYSDLAFGFARQ